MKKHTKNALVALASAFILSASPAAFGQAFPNWNGATASWSNNANWTGGNATNYGQLEFKGNGVAVTDMDFGAPLSQWRIYFDGTKAYTLGSSTGQPVNLFDFGGAHSWILSDAEAVQTFSTLDVNFAATSGASFGQVSARSTHDLVLNNLGITGSAVTQARFASEGAGDIVVNGGVSGASKQVIIGINEASSDIGSTDVTFNGANTYTGDTFIVAGRLHLGLASSLNIGSTIQLGQTSGTASATLDLASTTGGQTILNPLIVRAGSTGTKTIQSSATSGTNTFSGSVTLNADLTTSSAPGSTLDFIGTSNVNDKKLTVTGGGDTEISGALTSSLGTGGFLVKQDSGTLTLSNTGNSYTGTNFATLNSNGTQIAGGKIIIAGDTSLGLAPQAAYNNIQFTGSGTLQASSNIILNANRNISVAGGATADFNDGGNLFFINGIINGAGNVSTSGSSQTIFAGVNTYSGTTTVSSGSTLQLDVANSLGSTAAGTTVNSGGTLRLNGIAYSAAESLTINGAGAGSAGALANSGISSYVGAITVASNATINDGGGVLDLTGGITKNGTTLTITGGGRVNLNVNPIVGAAASSDLIIDGTTFVTDQNNTYNGPTSIINGATFIATNPAAGSATGTGDVTVDASSTIAGNNSNLLLGTISPGANNFITINGALVVGDPTLPGPVPSALSLTTSGTGSTVLGAGSFTYIDLFAGAGMGDNTGNLLAADFIRLFGAMNVTLGGTLVVDDPTGMGGFAAGDMWQVFDLTGGSIGGAVFALDYSLLGLGGGLVGNFNSATGVFSINAVPEPSRVLLLMLCGLSLVLRRRR